MPSARHRLRLFDAGSGATTGRDRCAGCDNWSAHAGCARDTSAGGSGQRVASDRVGGRIDPGTRIEVTELKRSSGGTLTLRFTIVNESQTTLDVAAVSSMLDTFAGYTVANVHLIDPVGRKKYFTAKDVEGKCVCSVYAFVQPGQRFNHWAKFPVPPDDVEKVSVVIPTFGPADDVPISR
jgi:hypothetical protein